jgi:hypothetical protein
MFIPIFKTLLRFNSEKTEGDVVPSPVRRGMVKARRQSIVTASLFIFLFFWDGVLGFELSASPLLRTNFTT